MLSPFDFTKIYNPSGITGIQPYKNTAKVSTMIYNY